MMKNIFHLKRILFTSQNSQILPSLFLNTPKFFFGAKKRGVSMMDDLMSKDSKSIDESSLAEDVTKSELFNDKKSNTITEKDAKETLIQSITDKKAVSSEKITTKILCELIGSKHYPCNEEILISGESVVTVYDESDKLLGNMFLHQALDNAAALDKDIVLRNDKVRPAIVKMMKYRVELVKRLFKKLGKNLGKDMTNTQTAKNKVYGFSLKMEKNDFESKLDKLRQLLADNNYVKVVIPVNLENSEQVIKANSILKNISMDMTQHAKLRAGPIKQKKTKENVKNLDPNIIADYDELSKHDKVIKDAYESASLFHIETEKDLDFIDSVYIELESLIVDSTGIDYEKLLKTTNLDMLVRGMTHSNVIGEINLFSQESKTGLSKEVIEDKIAKGLAGFTGGEDLTLKKQLKMLEKEAIVQNDYSKRLRIQEKINEMKEDIYFTKLSYNAKILKNKMMDLTIKSAKKEGLLERTKV